MTGPDTIRRIGCGALLLMALAAVGCRDAEPRYPLLGGGQLQLSELRGRPVLINYWAEWCAPCREEIPELNALATSKEDVRVLSVNFDGVSGDRLQAQVRELGIAFPTLLMDPRSDLQLPPAQALPETLVLDAEGNVFKVLVGPQTRATLAAAITDMTGKPAGDQQR